MDYIIFANQLEVEKLILASNLSPFTPTNTSDGDFTKLQNLYTSIFVPSSLHQLIKVSNVAGFTLIFMFFIQLVKKNVRIKKSKLRHAIAWITNNQIWKWKYFPIEKSNFNYSRKSRKIGTVKVSYSCMGLSSNYLCCLKSIFFLDHTYLFVDG